MKIAILGGGGCFALNFAKHLHEQGIEHFGIGRSKKIKAFWQVDHWYRFQTLHLVTELPAIMAVLDTERPDVIVNYAAQGEGAASFGENATDFFETNTTAHVRLVLELQKRNYLKRFIHIGTSELYGSTEKPAKETDPYRPSSPYAISKAAFDLYLESMWKNHRFPMNIVRPSNCYTPGQQLYRIIPKTIVTALAGRKLPLHGGGKAMKSYLHASDLSRAVMTVLEKAPAGEIYNVAPAYPVSIFNLVCAVANACGVSPDALIEEVPDRTGQDSKYWLDAEKIRTLGWGDTVMLGDGIAEMVKWVKEYPELLNLPTNYEHRK
jgi:dTDP-glucose 4,6-dehydratase